MPWTRTHTRPHRTSHLSRRLSGCPERQRQPQPLISPQRPVSDCESTPSSSLVSHQSVRVQRHNAQNVQLRSFLLFCFVFCFFVFFLSPLFHFKSSPSIEPREWCEKEEEGDNRRRCRGWHGSICEWALMCVYQQQLLD